MEHGLNAEHMIESRGREWQSGGIRLHQCEAAAGWQRNVATELELAPVDVQADESHAGATRRDGGQGSAEATGNVQHALAGLQGRTPDHALGEARLRGFEFPRRAGRGQARRTVPVAEMDIASGLPGPIGRDETLEIRW